MMVVLATLMRVAATGGLSLTGGLMRTNHTPAAIPNKANVTKIRGKSQLLFLFSFVLLMMI